MSPLRFIGTFAITLLCTFALSAQTTSGIASYYAPGLNGNKTSTGERYNHKAFTCANKEFPVGTTLKVTRIDDGRSVVVRVNDCGPHSGNRIIDLSGAAAEQIDLINDGIAQVRLEVVKLGTSGYLACGRAKYVPRSNTPVSYDSTPKNGDEAPQSKATPSIDGQGTYRADALRPIETGFGVQVGSYRVYDNAKEVASALQTKGYSKVLIRLKGNLHQVVLGPFETREQAETYKRNLRKNYKMNGFVTAITE